MAALLQREKLTRATGRTIPLCTNARHRTGLPNHPRQAFLFYPPSFNNQARRHTMMTLRGLFAFGYAARRHLMSGPTIGRAWGSLARAAKKLRHSRSDRLRAPKTTDNPRERFAPTATGATRPPVFFIPIYTNGLPCLSQPRLCCGSSLSALRLIRWWISPTAFFEKRSRQ